jgi:serine/threonine protein kinase
VNRARVVGGRYVVLAELGRGSGGVVWRAEDRVTGRQVAVKELALPADLPAAERLRFRERLLREARAAGRLDDPAVVTVHDVVTDEGPDGVARDHVVMDLVEARPLTEVVAADGPLDEPAAAALGRRLLAALRAAHEGGVVHGDLKPGNVLLGVDGRVAVTGFGIARAPDDARLGRSSGYLAPERVDGAPASPAADLWALGAVLFHAVEGVGPFHRDTPAATVEAVRVDGPRPTHCRGPLGEVVAGLLRSDPAQRLTAAEATVLLGTGGRHDPAAQTPGAPARRGLWVVIALAVVLAFVAGLLLGATLPG